MDEAHAVLERLERIDALDRANASPRELLSELRELLHEAEAWTRSEGGDARAEAAVERLRRALASELAVHGTIESTVPLGARDMIGG